MFVSGNLTLPMQKGVTILFSCMLAIFPISIYEKQKTGKMSGK